jgi:ABC-type multidrug transport system permease subunit
LIYGPGGYKYKDFLVVGTPMQVVLWILSIIMLSMMDGSNWWIFWIAMFLLLILIVGTRMFNISSLLPHREEKKEASGSDSGVEEEIFSV